MDNREPHRCRGDASDKRNDTSALLSVKGVGKSFGGTWVLHDIDFDLQPGEVHALMGENGAGKSTLMKILAGIYRPDAGSVVVGTTPVAFKSPAEASEHGIGIIHQELNVIPDMSVADSLALGKEPTSRLGVLDKRRVVREAREKLGRVGCSVDPTRPMGSLSVGVQQQVEIARAIAEKSKVLILDEPTAALTKTESERLFALIDSMRESGMGLIYISHRMEEVWQIADRVSVFRDGQHISTRSRPEITPERVVTDMIGRVLGDIYTREDRQPPQTMGLDISGLGDYRVGLVDFQVGAGEVVGMFGLIGAGRTKIARLIFGASPARGGAISVRGKKVRIISPGDAIDAGIAMLTEDRKSQGIFPDGDVIDNVGLLALDQYRRFGVLQLRGIRRLVQTMVDRLNIRSSSLRQPVSTLSGGNQQKVLLGRWLLRRPAVLLLDEPTRGVDVGAKAEIYRTINDLAAEGVAVLMISSDLPEVIGMSDRTLVVREGKVVANLARGVATEENVMMHATGVVGKEVP